MQGEDAEARTGARRRPPVRERPGWVRCMVGCAQLWVPFLVVWYGSAYLALEPGERDQPWRRLTPLTAVAPWVVLVVTVRLLPPRDWGFADRARRAMIGALVWTVLIAAADLAFGQPVPPDHDLVESVYGWIFRIFLYFHGNPLLLLPAFYLVERPWILSDAPPPRGGRRAESSTR